MNWSILLHGTGIWFILLMLALLNGLFRDQGYQRVVGELRAHQIGTVAFCLIIFGVTWLFLHFNQRGDYSTAELLVLGAWWALLTLLFEFGFFGGIMKVPREKLLADYNIFRGRIFGLVLLTCLFAPLLVDRLQR
jgi:hypothetical protein